MKRFEMKIFAVFVLILPVMIAALLFSSCTFEDTPENLRETVRASRNYKITFNSQGGNEISNQYTGYKRTLTQPDNPSRGGYVFGGWYLEPYREGARRWFFSTDVVTEDITLYARWADSATARAVVFIPNGGTPEPESPIVVIRTDLIPEPQEPDRDYHHFRGWFADSACTIEWDFDSPVGDPEGNTLNLYANWEIWKYLVFFNVEGNLSSANVDHGSKITYIPTKTDYVLYSWYCDSNMTIKWDSNTDTVNEPGITLYAKFVFGKIPGLNLAEKLEWLNGNVQTLASYDLHLMEDETLAPTTLYYSGKVMVTITLKGYEEKRTITLASYGSLFTVGSGVTLVLDNNIILKGLPVNTAPLVDVNTLGKLEMKNGSKITGNNYATGNGGGVSVSTSSGSFIMNGGEISGNSALLGGGIYVGLTGITMNGGKISDNLASKGGGVFVATLGQMNMLGGEISGNRAINSGGGVFVNVSGFFRMENGTVYGSNSTTGLANTAAAWAALCNEGIAQRGTMNGSTWLSNALLTNTNTTITIFNGISI